MAHEIPKVTSVHPTNGYSHVARVGKTLYVAGQVGKDVNDEIVGRGDIRAQARQIYTNMQNVLKECGGDLRHIVKMTTILTHYDYLDHYRAVRNEFFSDPYPPNTLLVVESLAHPDLLMEVEAIAELD